MVVGLPFDWPRYPDLPDWTYFLRKDAIINKLDARARYYYLDQKTNWQPSFDEIKSLINERTKALILINPSNPT